MKEVIKIEVFAILIWSLIWAIICQAVGNSKNINGFWWGFFLGIIGLIVVLCSNEKKSVTEINLTTKNTNTNSVDKYEQLEKLAKLKKSGTISDVEFEKEKNTLLK